MIVTVRVQREVFAAANGPVEEQGWFRVRYEAGTRLRDCNVRWGGRCRLMANPSFMPVQVNGRRLGLVRRLRVGPTESR